MKKFIKWIIISILPILLSGICFEVLLRKIPNDYSYKKNYLDRNSKKIRILFLGSSHVYYGINPEYISGSFNAAHVSQTLNYDLAILQKYKTKWDSLQYIVLSVDYFSLYGRLEEGVEAWRVKNYAIYYGLHTSDILSDYTEIFSNKFIVNESRFCNFYLHHKSDLTCSELGWGTGYNAKNSKDLVVSGETAAKRHFAKSDQYFNENVGDLETIISFAKARNIHVLLFTSPAFKTYVQNLDTIQLNHTLQAVTHLISTYDNARYYNLLADPEFTENDFYDADHLNEIGAKKLTIKIDRLLKMPDKKTNAQ
jgi:hypothetical protein